MMNLFINYNGKIVESNTPIIAAQNRGLRYGDGIFETIKYKNKQLILIEKHIERLWKGMVLLCFEIPKLFTKEKLITEILLLLKKNRLDAARVRLTIVRGNGGLFDAENHQPNYIIETLPLAEQNGLWNENGLQLCIYKDAKKSVDAFSNLKTNNYLPYLMGAIFAKKNHCNDAFILNTNNNICDSTIANIFYIKDKIIYTPSLAEGCVAGVMRHWLIQILSTKGYTVIQKAISANDVFEANEIFLTNSIYNIRWVAGLGNITYSNQLTFKIVNELMQKEKDIFC